MEVVDMPAIAERIKTAREEGDLKENAEYHAARETQGYTQAKINQLKTKLSHCHIVEKTDGPKDTVGFGSTVKVKDLSDDMEEAYELVGPGEEDYDGDVMKILTTSPIASALIGKKSATKSKSKSLAASCGWRSSGLSRAGQREQECLPATTSKDRQLQQLNVRFINDD